MYGGWGEGGGGGEGVVNGQRYYVFQSYEKKKTLEKIRKDGEKERK